MQARVDVLVPYGQADTAIHTFHAFGDGLLREHAFELGLSGQRSALLTRVELIVFLREHVFEIGLERYRPLGDPTRFLGALVDLFARVKDEDASVARSSWLPQQAARTCHARMRASAADELLRPRRGTGGDCRRFRALRAADVGERGFIDHSDQVCARVAAHAHEAHRPAAELDRAFATSSSTSSRTRTVPSSSWWSQLAGSTANVMAVGDPDQGIYGFRGASTGNVDRFRAGLLAPTTIHLRRNYRSLSPIVDAAERVLSVDRREADSVVQVAHRRGTRHAPASPRIGRRRRPRLTELRNKSNNGFARGTALGLRHPRAGRTGDGRLRAQPSRSRHRRDNGFVASLFDAPQVRGLLAFLRLSPSLEQPRGVRPGGLRAVRH